MFCLSYNKEKNTIKLFEPAWALRPEHTHFPLVVCWLSVYLNPGCLSSYAGSLCVPRVTSIQRYISYRYSLCLLLWILLPRVFDYPCTDLDWNKTLICHSLVTMYFWVLHLLVLIVRTGQEWTQLVRTWFSLSLNTTNTTQAHLFCKDFANMEAVAARGRERGQGQGGFKGDLNSIYCRENVMGRRSNLFFFTYI